MMKLFKRERELRRGWGKGRKGNFFKKWENKDKLAAKLCKSRDKGQLEWGDGNEKKEESRYTMCRFPHDECDQYAYINYPNQLNFKRLSKWLHLVFSNVDKNEATKKLWWLQMWEKGSNYSNVVHEQGWTCYTSREVVFH